MAKLGIFASLAAIIGVLTFASMPSSDADDKKPDPKAGACKTTKFTTEMVKEACEKGGQEAAKKAMQDWNKEKKIKSCNQCHTKLAPTYELKKDGLEQFKKLGGKLLEATKDGDKKPDAKK
jgi:hypothetical protein